MTINVDEIAAIEFEALDQSDGEELADEVLYAIGVITRLAQTIMSMSKKELTDAMRRAGPVVTDDALACFRGMNDYLATLTELTEAAEARVMIAMGAVAAG